LILNFLKRTMALAIFQPFFKSLLTKLPTGLILETLK